MTFQDFKSLLLNPNALFFKNIGTKQTIFKNTFWLMLGEAVTKIFGFILVIYIVRTLGVTEYGKFAFAFAFISIMSIFLDPGIVNISTREFSRSRDNEKNFNTIFSLEIVLCVLVSVVTIIASFFITQDPLIRSMMRILTVSVLSISLFGVTFSFLRARQKMEYEAAVKIFQATISAIAVLFVIFFIPSAKNLSYGYMFANIFVMFFVLLLFNVFFHRLSLKWDKKSLEILKISWPLSFGFTAGWLFIFINSVILGYFGLIVENGWYSAASKIALAAMAPVDLIARSFYPALSNFFVSSKETFERTWNKFAELMIFLTIPTMVGGVIMAPKIINFFYGLNFSPSILAFQMFVFVIAVSFISFPYAIVLIIADYQKKNFVFITMGAIINIVLDFILIPPYGLYGAIVATTIASVVVFVLIVSLFKEKMSIPPFNVKLLKAVLISFFSSIIMYFIISHHQIYNLHVILVCIIGGLVYAAVSYFGYRYFLSEA